MQELSSPKLEASYGKLVSLIWFIAHFAIYPLLFKLIWPKLIIIPDPYFSIFYTVSLITLVFGTYNIVMYFIYSKKIPFFQKYRVSHRPWLWETNPQQWKKLLGKTIGIVGLNTYFFIPSVSLLQYATTRQQNYLKSMQQWPSLFTIFWQSMFFLFMEDMGFYWSHYLLHKTRLYKYHKIHHQHVMAVTIGAAYAHPLEAALSNALPAIIGAIILSKFTPVHHVSIATWFIFGLVQTCQAHCGYEWTWRQLSFFPWKMGPRYHSFHHETYVENIGSIFIFWDNIMGTNLKYKKMISVEEKEK